MHLFMNRVKMFCWLVLVGGMPPLFGQIPDSTLANKYFEQGSAGIIAGQIDSAISYYERAEVHYRAAQLWDSYVNVANQLGETYIYLTRYEAGLAWLDTAQLYGNQYLGSAHFRLADTYTKRGVYHFYRGNFSEGLPYMRRAQAILEALPEAERTGLAATMNSLGFYHQHMGDMDSAIYYYQEALASWLESGGEDHPNVAVAYNNIGYCYRLKSDNDRGLDYYQRALKIRLKTLGADHPYLAATYSNIGACYQDRGDYALANEYYFKALAIQLKSLGPEHPNVGTTYLHLGVCYGLSGDMEEELEYLNQALRIRKAALGLDHPRVAEVLSQIGRLYGEAGAPRQQLEHAEAALKIWSDKLGPRHYRVAFVRNNIGDSYGKLGQPDQERIEYEQALELLVENLGEIHPVVAQQYFLIGGNLERTGQYVEALQMYQQALTTLDERYQSCDVMTHPPATAAFAQPLTVDLLAAKARTYLRVHGIGPGRTAALRFAAGIYQRADSLIGLIRTGLHVSDSRQTLSARSVPIYEAAIRTWFYLHEATGEIEPLHRAFDYSERSKALALQESLQESRARNFAGIPDSVLSQEQNLRIDLAFYEKNRFDLYQQPAGNRDARFLVLQNRLFALNEQYRAFVARLERDYPDYFRLKYDRSTTSLKQVQQWIGDRPIQVMHYFWGDSTLFVFAISGREVEGHSVPLSGEITEAVAALLKHLRAGSRIDREGNSREVYHEFTDLSYAVYAKILAPVQDTTATELVIVPDGLLSYLPFEVLLQNPATGHVNYLSLPYLLKNARLRYAHSAGLLIDPTEQKGLAASPLGGFAPTYEGWQGDEKWGALSSNQPEVVRVSELMDGTAFLAVSATESAFKRSGPNCTVLHLATHTSINNQNPLYSALVFSKGDSLEGEDGLLHAYEIYHLHLQTNLAVLSACETGIGQLARGEGVMSLARAFRYAGCPNIVTTLWQADDRASRAVMEAFYIQLSQGVPKDEALRRAKLAVLRNSSQQHPHYWAAFVLMGDNEALPDGAWWKQGVLILAGGLIFTGVVQFLRKNAE